MSQQLEETAPEHEIPNHMTLAIVATLFFPTGAAAIYYASKVKELCQQGEMLQAIEMARKVRQWSWLSIVAGSIFAIFSAYHLIKFAYWFHSWLENYLGIANY